MNLLFTVHSVSTRQSFVDSIPDSYELSGEILGVPINIANVPPELLRRIDEALRQETSTDGSEEVRGVDESENIDYALGNMDYNVGTPDE